MHNLYTLTFLFYKTAHIWTHKYIYLISSDKKQATRYFDGHFTSGWLVESVAHLLCGVKAVESGINMLIMINVFYLWHFVKGVLRTPCTGVHREVWMQGTHQTAGMHDLGAI